MRETYARGRKLHTRATVEQVIELVRERGVMSVSEIAEALDISTGNARGKADSAVYRNELVRDEYDDQGWPLHHLDWRYCEACE
jgi:predicted ArsR family transcriptional regulator